MTDERQNQVTRREVIAAYIEVLGRLEELVEVCSAVQGDVDELRSALQRAFGLSPTAADAVLAMQVRRFTPLERQKMQEELADIDVRLERNAAS